MSKKTIKQLEEELEILRKKGLVDENDKPIPAKPATPATREETINKWSKLRLLEGLEGNIKENVGKLFESQLSYIIDESGTTKQFEDIKFPIIRKAGNIEDPKQIVDD